MQYSLAQLENTYHWLCLLRKHFPPDADIWDFRYPYPVIRNELLQLINSGRYQFSPQQKIIKPCGNVIHLWSSQNVLVMKLIASSISLPLSTRCTHIKDHGGLKQYRDNLPQEANWHEKLSMVNQYYSCRSMVLMPQPTHL